jgi:hypothetical protein
MQLITRPVMAQRPIDRANPVSVLIVKRRLL